MTEETKTTETNTETEDTGLDAAELAADRVRGVDGKFLSRAAQEQAQKKKTEPTHRQETDATAGATSAAAPGATDDPAAQPAAGENAEEKTASAEVVKSDKLRRVLELEAKARETAQRVEAREREVVQFYEVAKQYETKLAEREKALSERERTWTPDAIHADPVGWLLDHQVDPDRLLQALADSNGQRRPQRQRDERDKAIEELQAEVRKLREDGPEWLRKEREQQRASEQAARIAEAERYFTEQAQDRAKYPNILRRYDADEVPYQIAKIFRTAAARGERLDDEAALGMLESTCRSKLDRITSVEEGQGAKAKGQAVGAQGNSSRESESSLSSVLSGQRATLPTRRPRAERLRDFDLGKIVISDE